MNIEQSIKKIVEEDSFGMEWHFLNFPWEFSYSVFLQQTLFLFEGTARLIEDRGLSSNNSLRELKCSILDKVLKKSLVSDFEKMPNRAKIKIPERAITQSLYQSQYYKVTKNEFSFLGYALCFEVLAQYFYTIAKNELPKNFEKSSSQFLCQSIKKALDFKKGLLDRIKKSSNKRMIHENFITTFKNYRFFIYSIYWSPYNPRVD